jgi:hypothetical protein
LGRLRQTNRSAKIGHRRRPAVDRDWCCAEVPEAIKDFAHCVCKIFCGLNQFRTVPRQAVEALSGISLGFQFAIVPDSSASIESLGDYEWWVSL